jgi:hypothetical protein
MGERERWGRGGRGREGGGVKGRREEDVHVQL